MNEKKLKSFVQSVVDSCTDNQITARSIAYEAYGRFDCPDELSEMPAPEALARLRKIAAEVLREKFENPASATPEHLRALKEYAERRFNKFN